MTPQTTEDTTLTLYSQRRRPLKSGRRRQSQASAAIALLLMATGVSAVALTQPRSLETDPSPLVDEVTVAALTHEQFEEPSRTQSEEVVGLAIRQAPPTWVMKTGPHPVDFAISKGDIATTSIEEGDYSLGAVAEGPSQLAPIPATDLASVSANLDPIDRGEIATGAVVAGAPSVTPRPHLRPHEVAARSARLDASESRRETAASKPSLSLILTSFGMNDAASRAALHKLPPEIAVAVAPVAENPAKWISAAQAQGRAALIEAPLETKQYPWINDSPYTLLTGATASENLQRLQALHALAPKADGVATYLGDAFSHSASALRPVLRDWSARGLNVVETAPGSDSRMGVIAADLGVDLHSAASLDAGGRAQTLDAGLKQLHAEAQREGHALGVALATPATIKRLATWVAQLEQSGVTLTPPDLKF